MNHNMNYGSSGYYHPQQQQQQQYDPYTQQRGLRYNQQQQQLPYGCEAEMAGEQPYGNGNFMPQQGYGFGGYPYNSASPQNSGGDRFANPHFAGGRMGPAGPAMMGPHPDSPHLGLGNSPHGMHKTESDLKQNSANPYGRSFAPSCNFDRFSGNLEAGKGYFEEKPPKGDNVSNPQQLNSDDRKPVNHLNSSSPADSGGPESAGGNSGDIVSKQISSNNNKPGDQSIHPGERLGVVNHNETDPQECENSSSNALERLKDLATSAKLTENVGEGFRQHRRASIAEEFGRDIKEEEDLSEFKFKTENCNGVEDNKNNLVKSEESQQMRGCESGKPSLLEDNSGTTSKPLQEMANNEQQGFISENMQGNAIQQLPGMQLGPYGDEQQHQQQQMWGSYGYGGTGIYQSGQQGEMNDNFQGMTPGGAAPGGGGIPLGYDSSPSPGWWMSVNQPGSGVEQRMGSPGFRVPGGPGAWGFRSQRPRLDRKGISPPPPGSMIRPGESPPLGDPNSPYPPYPGGGGDVPSDMMPSPPTPGSRKRGPGRPRAGIPGPPGLLETGGPGPILGPSDPPPPSGKTKGSSSTNAKKRYTCEICQKRFSTAWYVRVHRKSHNGERPYICHNCGKGFMLPNVLQVHLRKCEKNNAPVSTQQTNSGVTTAPPPIPSNPGLGAESGNVDLRPGSPRHPSMPLQNSLPSPYSDQQSGGHGMVLPQQQQPQALYGMSYNQRYGGYPGYPMPGEVSPSPYESQMMMQAPYGMPSPQQQQQQQQQQTQQQSTQQSNSHNQQGLPMMENDAGSFPTSHEMYGGQQQGVGQDQPPTSKDNPSPSSNHFLANDRPPDEGGGRLGSNSPYPRSIEKAVPPGVDPDLYCTTCEIQFDEKSSVEEHLKSHRPYMCEVCEKRFSQKCNLITHMRLHTGERPYPCSYCDKRFTQKGNLDAHMKTHTKEKPYPCIQCGKKFAFKSSMICHMKQSHHLLLNTPGISPLSSTDFDLEDDISSIKQQLKYGNSADHYQATPPSPSSNHFSSGIPTPQSSLDSLSGSQHGQSGYPATYSVGSEASLRDEPNKTIDSTADYLLSSSRRTESDEEHQLVSSQHDGSAAPTSKLIEASTANSQSVAIS